MSSSINASSAGIVETADSTGTLQIQTNGQNAIYIDGTQNVTVNQGLTVTGNLSNSRIPVTGNLIGSVTAPTNNPATGTPSSSTYLRGDGVWAAVSGTSGFVSVKDFGAVGNGTTDDTTAFVNAMASIVATGEKGVLLVPAGTYKITASLSVNISYISIWGESAVLNFSTLTTGAALVVNATVSPPYHNGNTSIQGIELIGNSTSGSVKGIQYTSTTDASQFSVDNCVINTFGIGESFETNSYLISHKNTNIWGCTVGVQNLTGFSNNGENISYVGCTIFNNVTNIVQTNGAGDMNFTNCSIDYPTTAHISITSGELHFVNCHIEGAAVPLFSNNVANSITSFTNCLLIQQSSSGGTPYITISGIVDFVGGRVVANSGTSPAITANNGASLCFMADQAQYGGSQLFNLVSGCFYNIISEYPILINGNYGTYHTSGNVVTDSNFVSAGTITAQSTISSNGNITSNLGGFSNLGNNAVTLYSSNTGMFANSGGIGWLLNGTQVLAQGTGNLQPGSDNTYALGSGGERWSVVYAATGTINTSDESQKQEIAFLNTAEKAVAQTLKGLIKSFKFNDSVKEKGSLARVHFGVIAQDVKAAFEAQGLNPDNYGVFCSDTWYELDGKTKNADGISYTKDTPFAIEITKLGVRYDELFALIIAGL